MCSSDLFTAINQALAAARAALGIASPSKVFEQQIGVQMSAGMAKGVLGGMGDVQAAVGAVSGGALGGVRGGGAATTTNNSTGPITIQVNAAPGQDVNAIARAVEERLNYAVGLRIA